MAFGHPAGLTSGTLKIAVTQQFAVADRGNRMFGLIGPSGRFGCIQLLGIFGGHHHQNAHLLAQAHHLPQKRRTCRQTAQTGHKPPARNAIDQQHGHKDQRVHQGNAQIVGNDQHGCRHSAHVHHQLQDGPQAVLAFPQEAHMTGHGVDKDHLAHLTGLHVQTAGQLDPADVAAHFLAHAGDCQHQLEGHVEHRHDHPQPGEPFKIHIGHQDHTHEAQADADALHHHHPAGDHFVLLGLAAAPDEHQSEQADDQRQHHQQHIGTLQVIPHAFFDSAQHLPASLRWYWLYFITPGTDMQPRGGEIKKSLERVCKKDTVCYNFNGIFCGGNGFGRTCLHHP